MQGVNAANGKRLAGTAHLRQSVFDILTTPIGSRVLVRDYGSDLLDLVDNPQDESTRVHIIAATASALAKWEPRLQVKTVALQFAGAGQFDLTIYGINTETGYPITLEELTINGDQFRDD